MMYSMLLLLNIICGSLEKDLEEWFVNPLLEGCPIKSSVPCWSTIVGPYGSNMTQEKSTRHPPFIAMQPLLILLEAFRPFCFLYCI